jgi:transcription initiation factor TFIIIB Brf1 subunit/transcription initiation factor TFIIB
MSGEMKKLSLRQGHSSKHAVVTTYVVRQHDGVPYEIARTVCAECGEVVEERLLRRAAA